MNLKIVKALLINSFQKEYRNKGILFLGILTLLLLFVGNPVIDFFAKLSGGGRNLDTAELVANKLKIFYLMIGTWSGLLGALLGVNSLRSDFEVRMVGQILAFPVKKNDYLFSRILGSWMMVTAYYLTSIVLAIFYYSYKAGTFAVDWKVFGGIGLTSLSILVYVLIGVLLALFIPRLMAFLSAIFLGIVLNLANWSWGVKTYEEFKSTDWGVFNSLSLGLHWLFPRVGVINNMASAVTTGTPIQYNIGLEVSHFVVATALLMLVISLVFKKLDYDL